MIKTRLALPVLAAVAAAAIFAGCGSSDSSSGADPATLAPPGSPLYVEGTVLPSGELQTNVETLAQSIAGVDDLGELIVTELEKSASDSGEPFDFAKEVEPWLGERAGVFFESYDGSDFTEFGAAVETTDADAATEFVEKQVGESEDEPEKGSYEGLRLLRVNPTARRSASSANSSSSPKENRPSKTQSTPPKANRSRK